MASISSSSHSEAVSPFAEAAPSRAPGPTGDGSAKDNPKSSGGFLNQVEQAIQQKTGLDGQSIVRAAGEALIKDGESAFHSPIRQGMKKIFRDFLNQ